MRFFCVLFVLFTMQVHGLEQQKLAFIQRALDQNADHSRYWQYGWTAFMGANLAFGSGLWLAADNDDDRLDGQVATVQGVLGTASMLLEPMRTHTYANTLSSLDQSTAQARLSALQQGESFLRDAALREQVERGWTNRLLSALVNGAAAMVIWKVGDRPRDAAIGFALGSVVNEVKAYTAPDGMTKAWAAYQQGDYELARTYLNHSHQGGWQMGSVGTQLRISYRF